MPKKSIKNILKKIKLKFFRYICEYKDINFFSEKPDKKFFFGLFLIFLSFVVGWGGPLLSAYKAFASGKNYILFIITGVSSYGISHGIFALGMLFTAKKNIRFLSIIISKKIYAVIRNPLERDTLFFIWLIALSAFVLFICKFITLLCFILIFILSQMFIMLGLLLPDSHIFFQTIRGKKLYRYIPEFAKNNIVFRFDDGAHQTYTPLILKILRKKNIKAIFALTGENIEKNINIVKDILSDGHIIANHTYSHPNLFSLLSYKKLENEIVKTNRIIKDICGHKTIFFAPPIGHNNIFLKRILKKENMIALGWDINSFDTRKIKNRTEKLVKKIERKRQKSSKPIVILFHDGIYKNTLDNRDDTLKTIEDILNIYDKNLLVNQSK